MTVHLARWTTRTGRMVVSILSSLSLVVAAAGGCSRDVVVAIDQNGDAATPDALVAPDGSLASLRSGLVGLWHLDEAIGSTIAVDSSGNAIPNDGTLKDLNADSAWIGGKLSGALHTNGAGYASVKPSSSIDSITNAVTVSAWIFLEGTIVEYATAISRQIGTGFAQHYHLGLSANGTPVAFINPGVTDDPYVRPLGNGPVTPMVWAHLAVTYDGQEARLYVNGNVVDHMAIGGALSADTTPVILGGNGNGASVTERFPGRIDEIALYNRALAPREITALATAPTF